MIEIKGKVVLGHTPGFYTHIFYVGFELPKYVPNRFCEHEGRTLDQWVQSNFDFKKLEGRTIRITAELVEE
jgi:hypothetical protein